MKSNRTRNLIIGGVAVLAVAAGGGAYAIADSSREKEQEQEKTLTKAETRKAEAAAGREVDGQVLYVEYEEDHGGGYEVEMQLEDGSEAEVYLDRSFNVAGVEREKDEHGEKGGREEHGEKGGREEHGEKGYEMEGQSQYGAAEKAAEPAMQGGKAGK